MGTMQLPNRKGMYDTQTHYQSLQDTPPPHIDDGIIVREAGTKHDMDRATSMSLSFMNFSQQTTHIHTAQDIVTTANIDDIVQDTYLHGGVHVEHGTYGFALIISTSQDQHSTSCQLHLMMSSTLKFLPNPTLFKLHLSRYQMICLNPLLRRL